MFLYAKGVAGNVLTKEDSDSADELPKLREEDREEPTDPHETDVKVVEFSRRTQSFVLAMVAPAQAYRISPTRSQYASLGFAEEHFIENFIENFIDHARKSGIPRDKRTLHLLLHSPGGLESSSFVISKCLRKNFGKVVTYVPHIAASGATVIALPSDEIVMGEISRLSPIDVQLYGPDGVRSALSVIRGVELMNRKYARTRAEDIPYPDRVLIESVDLPTWDDMRCSLLLAERYAKTLLKLGGFQDKVIPDIARTLVYGYHEHETVIDLDEARKIGLRATPVSDRVERWSLMRKLYSKYLFEESPYHHVRFALPNEQKSKRKAG